MNDKKFKMDNLRNLRQKKNLTQRNLSLAVEVSQELISQYEIGTCKPNIDNLIKLADYFNCSTDYLLGRTNNFKPIDNLENREIQHYDIIEKYDSLSPQNKKHFNSYLEHLCTSQNK